MIGATTMKRAKRATAPSSIARLGVLRLGSARPSIGAALLCLCCLVLVGLVSAASESRVLYERRISYVEYLDIYREAQRPDKEIVIPADSFTDTDMDVVLQTGLGGYEGTAVVTDESGYIEWEFDVEEAGLYNIEIRYFPMAGRGMSIEREIRINGETLFDGAHTLTFHRIYADSGPVLVDTEGNQIRPSQMESPIWRTVSFADSVGYELEPLKFYFREGKNTLRLISRAEPMAIDYLRIYQAPSAPTYASVVESYSKNGYQRTVGQFIKVQAEDAILRSSPSLFAVNDQGDPTVEPYDPALIRLNSIGGYRWQNPGDWITWEFEVPVDGLYKIALKAKQDQDRGIFSNRKVYIDGEVPFSELDPVEFPYTSRYHMRVLGEEETGEPYLFYLTKGRHTLTLEVSLGRLADFLRRTEESLYELNGVYRSIIMITSANPDPLRSYELDKRVPGLLETLKFQSELLYQMAEDYEKVTGEVGGHSAVLRDVGRLLKRMYDKPDRIPGLLGEFRDSVGNLGTWIMKTRNQPLQLDYIIIASVEQKMPKAAPSLLQTLIHEIRAFIASFTYDYSGVSDIYAGGGLETTSGKVEPLKVWIGLGRDQAQVLKQMLEESFTPKTGIPVELELVSDMGSLLVPATIAGTAPDVALGAADLNLAFRGAVADLTQFPDFPEVALRFKKSALVPFRFRDKVFGLPETQSFPMLFYRADILDELGLEVPQTWEDVYNIIPELQKRNLEFGLSPSMSTYLMFLYQKGVPLYKEDCVETNLQSEAAIATFKEMTDLFVLYGLPLSYDFLNRFRMGEMPLAIVDYSEFNRLSVFAPELRGQWGFAQVPGTRMPDGTINRAVAVGQSTQFMYGNIMPYGTTASMIMSHSEKKAQAWEFLKWWTSEETQVQFGREMENLLGAAARYATANVEAMQQLPWSYEDRLELNKQWDWVEGNPPVLGGYYVTRQFDWLFRAVVLQNKPLRQSVMEYDREANIEIARKRAELGYETDIEAIDQKWKDLYWSHYTHLYRLDYDGDDALQSPVPEWLQGR